MTIFFGGLNSYDFIFDKKSVSGTASEICSMLKEKYPEHDFNCNWLYRDLLQHDDEIRSLGIDYEKNKTNGIRSIFISYNSIRDSSGGKILCAENAVPADPESVATADVSLLEGDRIESLEEENADTADTAVPDNMADGYDFVAKVAERMRNNLTRWGIILTSNENFQISHSSCGSKKLSLKISKPASITFRRLIPTSDPICAIV